MNIVLCGMMGAGKTTVGILLAERTGMRWYDTDDLITERHGNIPSLFEFYGEEHFRQLESEVVHSIANSDNCVISTGGGAAVYSTMFFAMSTFLSGAIRVVLMPVMQIYFCFSVSAAVWGNAGIDQAASLFARCLSCLLKWCGALFSLVLGLQNMLAASVDNTALRMGRSVLSGMIPVVGDAAAVALTGAAGAVQLLKGSLALALTAAMGGAFLPVFVRCALYFLAFSAAGILAAGIGQKQCGQICRSFAEGSRLCGSVLTLYFFMVFLSTALLLITGTGGN